MNASIVTLATRRSDYSAKDAAEKSLTVGELIELLQQFDEDSKIVFSNDNGYTYGLISRHALDEMEEVEYE